MGLNINIGQILQLVLSLLEFGHSQGWFDKAQASKDPVLLDHLGNVAQHIVATKAVAAANTAK